jgi:putative hydrolase of the HAD superfamily
MDRLRRFFRLIGREDASDQELLAFRTAYKKRYRSSYRATPGTIETLIALREQGYKIGIITNAGRASQQAKIDGIGIAHLIDGLIASGDFEWAKPDSRIFHHAMSEFGITYDMRREDGTTYMVGDSIQNDVEGAARAGLDPVLYSPESSEWFMEVWGYGFTVPVMNHMSQLLDIL